MPEQGPGEPATQRDAARKREAEQWRGIVDLPTRADHHQHGDGIDPVRQAHPQRVDDAASGGRRPGAITIGGNTRHGMILGWTCWRLASQTRETRYRFAHARINST